MTIQTEVKKKAAGYDRAKKFMSELLDAVETLTAVGETYGNRTLADIVYLHNAILTGGFIDHYPDESAVVEIVSTLPSALEWKQYITTEYMSQKYVGHEIPVGKKAAKHEVAGSTKQH